jgi:hypothetical protein
MGSTGPGPILSQQFWFATAAISSIPPSTTNDSPVT